MQDKMHEFENLLGGFYLHNDYIVWVYFNPDAVAGGQIVINYLSLDTILAAKRSSHSHYSLLNFNDVTKFDDYLLEHTSKCELIDIDNTDFGGNLIYWLNEHRLAADEPLLENRKALVRAVEVLQRGGL